MGGGGGLLGLLWQLQLRSDDSWQPVPVKPADVDTVGQMTRRRNKREDWVPPDFCSLTPDRQIQETELALQTSDTSRPGFCEAQIN